MPIIDFKGKTIVESYHFGVPFRNLKIDEKKSTSQKNQKNKKSKPSLDDNLIIHGDNLHALKALMPRYARKIKCIYIDPPYNTGNEGWKYNDNTNSPLIKEWLKKEVGAEDLERHDKWLCMMWPRLQLLKELLAEDGVIFISIDDNEQHRLRMLMDEIFGEENFVSLLTWVRKKKGSFLSTEIRKMTEFVLAYKQNSNEKLNLYGEKAYSEKYRPIVKRENQIKQIIFPKDIIQTTLSDGVYRKIDKLSDSETGVNFKNDFTVKNSIVITELKTEARFTWTQIFLDNQIEKGSKIALSNKFGFNVLKYDQNSRIKAPSTLINQNCKVGTNEDATEELNKIFNSGTDFKYNKPVSLIKFLLKSISNKDKDCIILDSFAGSGTTAQAVLELNKEDGGNRKFIIVECEDYADAITAERVRRVINGIPESKNKSLQDGLDGRFTYCVLGKEISEENLLKCKGLPSYEALSKYVFYTATGKTLSEVNKNEDFFIAKINEDTAYFVIYKPNKKFLRSNDSVLNLDRKKSIQKLMKQKKCSKAVVFATTCFYPREELSQDRITFCQLPFSIHRVAGP